MQNITYSCSNKINSYYYELKYDRVEYTWKEAHLFLKGEVFFEQLGAGSEYMKRSNSSWLILSIIFAVVSIACIIGFSAPNIIDRTFLFIGLGGIIFSVLFLVVHIMLTGKFIQLYNGSRNLSIFYTTGSKFEAEEFAKKIISARNTYLRRKYEIIQPILSWEEKKEWLHYLYSQFVINRQEMDELTAQTNAYRSEPSIGFKISNKSDNPN